MISHQDLPYVCIDGSEYYYEAKYKFNGGQAVIHQVTSVKKSGEKIAMPADYLLKVIQPFNETKLKKEAAFLHRMGLTVKATCDDDRKRGYLLMENCGLNSKFFLREQQGYLTLSDRFQLILAFLNEMELLELKGIFHRDLKPENVCIKVNKITNAYDVRIIDFGYATFANSEKKKEGCLKGTFEYLAPDSVFTFASDRYSLAPIIALILGCNFKQLMEARKTAHRAYKRLSEEQKQLYSYNTLPGYDFNSLSTELYPENSRLRENLIHVLSTLAHSNPEMRYDVQYLLVFFQELYKASGEEKEIGLLDSLAEAGSSVLEMADDKLEKVNNFFCGTGEWINKKKKPEAEKKTSVTYKSGKEFYTTNYCALTRATLRGSPESYFQALVKYRDKFEGTNSDGIIKIFDEMEAVENLDVKIQKISNIAQTKIAPSFSLFSCVAKKPRHENINNLYEKFSRLQPGEAGNNFPILDEIETDIKTLNFI